MSVKIAINRFLVHPVFLSLVASVFIVLVFIPVPGKFKLQVEDETYPNKVAAILYDDLDGNGYSDKIMAENYASENKVASMVISCYPSQSFNEWDFKGFYSFADKHFLITGDYDNDGKKEVYVFTVSSDSVFLNIIKDPKAKIPVSSKKFITRAKPWNGKPQLSVFIKDLLDMNNDTFKDLIFSVNAGFSADPRRVYIYDIKNDSLISSPEKGYYGRPSVIGDINGDGYNEIILNGYAIQNVQDTIAVPIHDKCCWLIVYDHNLNYLFTPRKFPDIGYSALTTVRLQGRAGQSELFGLYIPPETSGKGMKLIHFDHEGNIIKTCSIPGNALGTFAPFITFKRGNLNYLAVSVSEDEIKCFDTAFNLATSIKIKPGMFCILDSLDIDADGFKEVISVDGQRNLFTVFRHDLIDPVSVILPGTNWSDLQMSVVKKPGSAPLLSIFNGRSEVLISYQNNPFYFTRWLVYLAIFLSIFLFVILVRRIQRAQILKHQQTEKKITELQLKIVRSQMDPHFTLNAVNSVIAAINENEKEQATRHLIHFSKMYRHLVLTADKIKYTLAEEIDFTRNYLNMEKFRFRDKFDFEFDIPEEFNLDLEVPKMVIQSPVENALKHGLLNLQGKGHLKISAKTIDHHLILEITDNGIGRKKAEEMAGKSTGKGMKAMEEFLMLYQKITGTKVVTLIEDLADSDGKPLGTNVIVKIQMI